MKHSPEFLKLATEAKKKIKEVTVQDVAEKIKRKEKFFFVDVREDDEFRQSHAEGAIHIGKGVIERDIETIIADKSAEIVLYCGGGFRSALAAEAIMKMGYKNVISMDGGIRGWMEAGLPLKSKI
jgi:rhodanese-related sulfurtransferase